MRIEIKVTIKHGLETHRIFVNGTYAAEFLSAAGARSYVISHFPNAKQV
jgi:hypothetical protein